MEDIRRHRPKYSEGSTLDQAFADLDRIVSGVLPVKTGCYREGAVF